MKTWEILRQARLRFYSPPWGSVGRRTKASLGYTVCLRITWAMSHREAVGEEVAQAF